MRLGRQMGRQKVGKQTAFAEKSMKQVWRPVTQKSVKEKIQLRCSHFIISNTITW